MAFIAGHMPGPHVSGKIAVVGHTPQPEILNLGHLICLDTGCAIWRAAHCDGDEERGNLAGEDDAVAIA